MTYRISRIALLLTLGSLVGCASVGSFLPVADDISEQRSDQREMLMTQYDEQRNEAMLAAARSRIEEGNDQLAEDLLLNLLDRDENLIAARLLLADVYLFRGRFDLATAQIDQVLQATPENGAALHAMGLLLEASGHGEASRAFYAEAARLEPENRLFALSCHFATDAEE